MAVKCGSGMGQSSPRSEELRYMYLRAAIGVTRMYRVRNEEVYERCGMAKGIARVNCVEWVKRNALRWYGHVRRMPEERMAKRVYQSKVSGELGRGRPPMTWECKVEQYNIMKERVGGGLRGLEAA